MILLTKDILLILFCFSSIMLILSPVTLNKTESLSTGFFNKYNRYLLFVVTALLIFAAVVKPPTMADYSSYVRLFQGLDQNERMEPAFTFIVKIIERFWGDYFILFLVFSLISITIRVYSLYKYSPVVWGSIVVYLSNIYILHDLIQIRAAVASALLYLVVYFSYKRKLWLFVITVIVSLSFHYSSIIYILIWFISHNNNPQKYILLVALSYFLHLVHLNLGSLISYIPFISISSLLTSYAGREGDGINVFNLIQLSRLVLAFLFFFNLRKIQKEKNWYVLFLKIYIIGLCFLPLFSSIPGASLRLMELFVSCETIVIPMGFLLLFRNNNYSKIAILAYSIFIFNIYFNAINYWDYDWLNF